MAAEAAKPQQVQHLHTVVFLPAHWVVLLSPRSKAIEPCAAPRRAVFLNACGIRGA